MKLYFTTSTNMYASTFCIAIFIEKKQKDILLTKNRVLNKDQTDKSVAIQTFIRKHYLPNEHIKIHLQNIRNLYLTLYAM